MDCMTIEVDPEIDAAFPGKRAANICIETVDGQLYEHFQPNRKGDPEDPLTDAELDAKLLELASPVLGKSVAEKLAATLWSIDRATSVDFAR